MQIIVTGPSRPFTPQTTETRDVERLTAALSLVIEDRDLRRRLGLASHAVVEKEFAPPEVLAQFWQLYSTLRFPVPQVG